MTRQEMVDTPVTLDGLPAKVCGTRLDFPVVRSAVTGVEFAWQTVEYVITHKNGAFQS